MTEYGYDIQKLLLELMLQDGESYIRVQNIFNKDNFTTKLQPVAELITTHSEKYNTLPDLAQIQAITGLVLNPVPSDVVAKNIDWFLDEFEQFTRRQEIERAILLSADLLQEGNFDPVEKLVLDAVRISLTKDMGIDYFADPRARLEAIKNNNGQVSTGWANLDQKLYGGFNRGELQIFAGGSGSGKSLFMQNLSVNWLEQGLNGVFLTLELNEELCSMRIDSMITDIATKSIFKSIDDVDLKIKIKAKKFGKFRVKYMPAQSTVNDIRSYIKELEVMTGLKADFLCIDYLDLLMPVSAKVSPSDLFVKDKYVSEEIRNLAKELNVICVTASQLNRSAVEEIEFDHSMISGGISKINTADNVFGIFTSRAMKERGRYQLQLMKTRSSAGVGQKIDLEFNVETLRISDADLDSEDSTSGGSASNIMNSIKAKTTLEEPEVDIGKITSEIKSKKLKNLIGKIHPE